MPYIGSLGEQAAGFIDKDIANHQHHFENLLYADRLDEESKLWIGLHPISEPEDNQSISKLEPIAREYLLRGLGSNEHSFPVGVLRCWTARQRKDFIYFQLRVRNEECKICASPPDFTVNATTPLLSHEVMSELASHKGLILEIQDFPSNISGVLGRLKSEHPGLVVWLDDVPPEKWPLLPELLKQHENLKGVKIDTKISMIVLQKSEPMLAPGVSNAPLKKIWHDTMVQASDEQSKTLDQLRAAFKVLVQAMVEHGKSKLVMEIHSSLADFEWTGCGEALRNSKILATQGRHTHAMVQRIHCDYRKLAIDTSREEQHVPQRFRN